MKLKSHFISFDYGLSFTKVDRTEQRERKKVKLSLQQAVVTQPPSARL
jgi:hypothetical protein